MTYGADEAPAVAAAVIDVADSLEHKTEKWCGAASHAGPAEAAAPSECTARDHVCTPSTVPPSAYLVRFISTLTSIVATAASQLDSTRRWYTALASAANAM
ncbi:hypothetical protein NESM_000600600 [Novymonas esmeraldas]|uniref:Uncharacterized protein n=1 Tax=Novymonas esmeraldas TaxID=1808958 RepID=A0AAW0EUG1_9TRYP